VRAPSASGSRERVAEIAGGASSDTRHEDAGSDTLPRTQVRVLSGVVRDLSGPLSAGAVVVLHPLRVRGGKFADVRAPIDLDGGFRCELSSEVHDLSYVFVNIYDDEAMVFAGGLEVREGVDVMVRSTRTDQDPFVGEIRMPDAREDDRWWIWIAARHGSSVTDVASIGDERAFTGRRADIRILFQSPLFRRFEGQVALVVLESSERVPPAPLFYRQTLGHAVFDSLDDLRSSLLKGLEIRAPLRRIEFVSDGSPEPQRVVMLPAIGASAIYSGGRDDHGAWLFHLPDGEYDAAARIPCGTRRTARVSVLPGQTSFRVRWTASLPGPESIEVVVLDCDGQPVPDALVRYAVTDSRAPRHNGRIDVLDADGRGRADGLLAATYTFQAGDATGTMMGFAPADPSKQDSVELRVSRLGTVVLDPLATTGILGERIDAGECSLWWRLVRAETAWTEVPLNERRHGGFAITGLPVGEEVELAIRGDWWFGRTTVVVSEQLVRAPIALEPMVVVSGAVQGDAGLHDMHVCWRTGQDRTPLPWQEHALRSDGRFSLHAPLERLTQGSLVVARDGVVLATHALVDGRTDGIVIRMPER
jgi:hypothetical protein